MKRKVCMLMVACALMIMVIPKRVSAQEAEIQQLLLNIEKLNQLRQILSNMYKGYQILSEGYLKIRDITSGNYKLHEVFFDGLLAVSPTVRKYKRIADIITMQVTLVKEYKSAWNNFRSSGQFSEAELKDLYSVYSNLVGQSAQALDELIMVVTAGELRMSDSERLEGIDRIHGSMEEKLMFLRDYNKQYGLLALNRARDTKDIGIIKDLYNIK